MNDNGQTTASLFQSHPEQTERPEVPSIHYSQLPAASPDHPMALEYDTYRREVGRLLVDGHEGKFVLIKGEAIFGLFESLDAVHEATRANRHLRPFLLQRVLTYEPLAASRGVNIPWLR